MRISASGYDACTSLRTALPGRLILPLACHLLNQFGDLGVNFSLNFEPAHTRQSACVLARCLHLEKLLKMMQAVEWRREKGNGSKSHVATLEAELAEKQRQISELQEQLSLVRSDARATPMLAVAEEDVAAAPREASEAAAAFKHQVCVEHAMGPCSQHTSLPLVDIVLPTQRAVWGRSLSRPGMCCACIASLSFSSPSLALVWQIC